jgi:cation diffusion facilitator family transporter
MKRLARKFEDPFVVMSLVSFVNLTKWLTKVTIGRLIASPMITSDGWHNLADLFMSCANVWAMAVGNRPKSQKYHFGRKNIEFLASLAIGIALIWLSFQFAAQSISGVLANWPDVESQVRAYITLPAVEPMRLNDATFPWAVGIITFSIVCSYISSKLQIKVGKMRGHPIMVASGEEALSDVRIEFVTLSTILLEHYGSLALLEYPVALLVSVMIFLTGWELFLVAYRVLLHRSIGAEHEEVIAAEVMSVPGVLGIKEMKTFQVGHRAVILLRLITMRDTRVNDIIRLGIKQAVNAYILTCEDFKECEVHFEFQPPETKWSRVAFAVIQSGHVTRVAESVPGATHFIVCTVESYQAGEAQFSRIIRTERLAAPGGAVLLAEKQVESLYVMDQASGDAKFGETGIVLRAAVSQTLSTWGMSDADFEAA